MRKMPEILRFLVVLVFCFVLFLWWLGEGVKLGLKITNTGFLIWGHLKIVFKGKVVWRVYWHMEDLSIILPFKKLNLNIKKKNSSN